MRRIIFGLLLGISCAGCFSDEGDRILKICPLPEDYSNLYIPDSIREKYDINQRFKLHRAWKESGAIVLDWFVPNDSSEYTIFTPPNMKIREVFAPTKTSYVDNMYDPNSEPDKQKFAVYTVRDFHSSEEFVLLNNEEITVINMGEYVSAVRKLLEYFEIHPELDERFLPLCVQELTKIYVRNQYSYAQGGPWRHWWGDKADSLGKIYNQYLKF